MLNNPFRYLRRKWTMQSTDDDLHCIRYSLLVPVPWLPCVPTDWYLQVEEPPTNPLYRPGSSEYEKGTHESFLLCSSTPMSCGSFVKYMGTSNACSERAPLAT